MSSFTPNQKRKYQKRVPKKYNEENVGKRLHNRNWDNMDLLQRIQDVRLQFICSIQRLEKLPDRSTVTEELRQLSYYIWYPLNRSTNLNEFEKKKISKLCLIQCTKKLPQTKGTAIAALERRIHKCDSLINKLLRNQQNEFMYTMGIRRIDMEPSAIDLFKQIFEEEIQEAAQA